MFIEIRSLSQAGVAGWLNENKITPKEIIKLDLSSDGRCLYCLAWKPDESQKEIDDTQEKH